MSRSLDLSLVISPTKFAHIVFRTKQLKVMVNWYARVLGTKSAYENDFAAFVTYDDEHHRLAFLQLPDLVEAPPQSIGLEHFAYTFESLGDLMQTYKRLKSEGISPAWTINHGPTTSLYYDDPDGNRVELQIDNFKSAAEAQAFMDSETFNKNPIGVEFDPEKLLARYEQGDPLEELIKQGAASK